MFSLEPFTMRDIGSPQVFQTGETFGGAPLIDYQHPHDLVMNLGAELTHSARRHDVIVAAYAVGPAPIGPPVFMHRPSAAENPQAPLSHHYLDATHITPGVVSLGVERSGFRARGRRVSWPRARRGSPRPRYRRRSIRTAAALSWADGPWSIQLSGADLKTPERTSAYDATRVTASVVVFQG